MAYVKKFKQLLNNIAKEPKQTASYRALTAKVNVTADPERIHAIHSNKELTRAGFSRRIIDHTGAVDAWVAQDDAIAKIKRQIAKPHMKMSAYTLVSNECVQGVNLDLYETVKNSRRFNTHAEFYNRISQAMLEHVAGINLTKDQRSAINTLCHSNAVETPLAKLFFLNYFKIVPKFVKNLFAWDLKKRNDELQEVAEMLYQSEKVNSKGLFADLLQAEKEGILTHRDVLGELRMILINSNSMAVAMMWAMYAIAKNPQHADRIANEDEYARLAFMEVLRMYPPFHMLAYESKNISKCPVHFWKPKEAELVLVRGAHMSEKNWSQPEVFDPNRFAKGLGGLAKGSYIPFGGGERSCPGSGLAMVLGPSLMQSVCKSFVIELACEPVIKRRVELLPEGNKISFNIKIRKN